MIPVVERIFKFLSSFEIRVNSLTIDNDHSQWQFSFYLSASGLILWFQVIDLDNVAANGVVHVVDAVF